MAEGLFRAIRFAAALGNEGGRYVLDGKGPALGVLLMLGAGAATAATPCIYPIIPVVVGFFGAQGKGRKLIALSALFALGVAAAFSALGSVSALTGRMLGFQLQQPAVVWGVAGIIALAGILTLAGTTWRLPSKLSEVVRGRAGYGGALVMGATLGVVALPCVGPFIVGLLTYVAGKGSVASGATLFLAFGLGLAIPVVLVGNVSTYLVNLPRGGAWNAWAKKLMGVVLIVAAVYFARPVLPEGTMLRLMGLVVAAGGIVSGFVGKWAAGTRTETARRVAGVAMVVLGVGIVLSPEGCGAGTQWRSTGPQMTSSEERERTGEQKEATGAENAAEPTPEVEASAEPASEAAVSLETAPSASKLLNNPKDPHEWPAFDWEQAKEAAKEHPVMVLFSAEWCVACRELESKTLQDERVVARLRHFQPFLADVTTNERSPATELAAAVRLPGTPTMLFYVHDGRIIGDLIASGALGAEDMLRLLDMAEAVYDQVKKEADEKQVEGESTGEGPPTATVEPE